jgi:hypothetical protein
MKTTIEYLEKALKDSGLKNWSELAKALGWTTGGMAHYRAGNRVMSRKACLQLAAFLKLDLKEALELLVLAEQEESGQLPLNLKDYFRRVAVWIGFIVLLVGSATESKNSMAAPTNFMERESTHAQNAQNLDECNSLKRLYIIHYSEVDCSAAAP